MKSVSTVVLKVKFRGKIGLLMGVGVVVVVGVRELATPPRRVVAGASVTRLGSCRMGFPGLGPPPSRYSSKFGSV